jgi:hypothetical protein
MLRAFRKIRRWFTYRIHGTKKPWLHRIDPSAPAALEHVFTHIYTHNLWEDAESVSGAGSNLAQTRVLRESLPELLRELRVATMLDIPCGDYHWMSQVKPEVAHYLGADIVAPLVEANQARYQNKVRGRAVAFVQLNLLTAPLPRVDLILCRDCLVHFSNADVWQALRQFKQSGSTYLLTTTHPARSNDKDIRTGEWRPLNLGVAPFNLPRPMLQIVEESTDHNGKHRDKTMALWRVGDLPVYPPPAPPS